MQTIDDIVFDNIIFPRANSLALLLYHIDGVSIAIPLSHADLMSFIQVFQNTTGCHNHITINNNKKITLFTFEHNIQWLIENSYLDTIPHVQKIKIFCSSPEDQEYWTMHTQRYREKIEKPFLYTDLNLRLLLFGITFLKKIYTCRQFANDVGIQNRLREDLRRIREALGQYTLEKKNSCDDRTNSSNESQI